MVYEVVIPEDVEREVDETVLWYEEQHTGLGIRFYSILLEKLEKLKSSPQYYFYIHDEYRRVTIDPFPFSIIYKIYGSAILILAVLHHSRNPAELLKRIK